MLRRTLRNNWIRGRSQQNENYEHQIAYNSNAHQIYLSENSYSRHEPHRNEINQELDFLNDFRRRESEAFVDSLINIFGSHILLDDYLLEDSENEDGSSRNPTTTPGHIAFTMPENNQPNERQEQNIRQRHNPNRNSRNQRQNQNETHQMRQNQRVQIKIQQRKQVQNEHLRNVQQREMQRVEKMQREKREQMRKNEQRWHQIQLIKARKQQEYLRKQQHDLQQVQKKLYQRQHELNRQFRHRDDQKRFRERKQFEKQNKSKISTGISKNEEKKEDPDLCIVCYTNPIDVVLIPCGHNRFCRSCCDKLTPKICPERRTDIQSVNNCYR